MFVNLNLKDSVARRHAGRRVVMQQASVLHAKHGINAALDL